MKSKNNIPYSFSLREEKQIKRLLWLTGYFERSGCGDPGALAFYLRMKGVIEAWRIIMALKGPEVYLGEKKTILRKGNLEIRRGKRLWVYYKSYVIGYIKE